MGESYFLFISYFFNASIPFYMILILFNESHANQMTRIFASLIGKLFTQTNKQTDRQTSLSLHKTNTNALAKCHTEQIDFAKFRLDENLKLSV
jgi:hypothetical protein